MSSNIQYAKNKDGQYVAYEVTGGGDLDIVFIPDWVTNLEVQREEPAVARFLDRLASFGRLIFFDKRGSGISDPVPLGAIPTPEEWMDDVRTVMDDLGSQHAVLFGHGEGVPMAILFAATHPERTTALVLADGYSRRCRAADYPCGVPKKILPQLIEYTMSLWGSGESARIAAPSEIHNPAVMELRGRLERLSMSPGEFAAMRRDYSEQTAHEIDCAVRDLITTAFEKAVALLKTHNAALEEGAKNLLEKETLLGEELPEL